MSRTVRPDERFGQQSEPFEWFGRHPDSVRGRPQRRHALEVAKRLPRRPLLLADAIARLYHLVDSRASAVDSHQKLVQVLPSHGDAVAPLLDDHLVEPRYDEDTFREADILLVDDDPASIQLLGRILAELGNVRFATCGEDALRIAHEAIPDLILLDAEMPGMSGFELCRALKADPDLKGVPVIFVTSHTEEEFEVSGFNQGAADFIAKPVSAPLVIVRMKTQLRVKRMADEMRRIATTDMLTGVSNRRGFEKLLSREWLRARRSGEPLALLMIDVDYFKLFNDRYGHSAGDACLRSVASVLAHASRRPADAVARYGGEEFVILLPQTPRGGAEHVAHEILGAVDALRIVHEGSPTASHLTVSIGVGCYDGESACWVPLSPGNPQIRDPRAPPTPFDLVNAADKALYAAKHAGRARGMLLDIADVESPESARDLSPRSSTPGGIVHGSDEVSEAPPISPEARPFHPDSLIKQGS